MDLEFTVQFSQLLVSFLTRGIAKLAPDLSSSKDRSILGELLFLRSRSSRAQGCRARKGRTWRKGSVRLRSRVQEGLDRRHE